MLLLKRLESSIEAFRSTLTSLMNSNRNFKQALEAELRAHRQPLLPELLLQGQSFDADDLSGSPQPGKNSRRQLRDDPEIASWSMQSMTSRRRSGLRTWIPTTPCCRESCIGFADIGPEEDDKLQTLREFLELSEVRASKVLIFSEAGNDHRVSVPGVEP